MTATVAYEVDLEVDAEILDELDAWLAEHVAEMTRLPGFAGADILVPDGEPATRRRVRYLLRDREALEQYLTQHASRMRQQGIDRFGERIRAERRVGELCGTFASETPPVASCRNCGAGLAGQYCAHCGQRAGIRLITLWEFFRDLIGDLFELDSRLWRTLRPLIFWPGKLTAEYLSGRRVAYVPPLRLYIGLSLIFFLFASFDDTGPTFGVGRNESGNISSLQLSVPDEALPAEESAPAVVPDDSPQAEEELRLESSEDCQFDIDSAKLPDWLGWLAAEGVETRIVRACEKIVADRGESLLRALASNTPAMMFFFLPLLALYMKPLYLFGRRYYIEHLLFLVHYHAFVFLLLTIAEIISALAGLAPSLRPASVAFAIGSGLYIPLYLYKAMRRVYGQGRVLTTLKYVVLAIGYFFSLLLSFLGLGIYTALTL